MPTSKPRKPRKRSREIRERSRTTGAQFTKAMRANDRERQAARPAGAPLGRCPEVPVRVRR
ncbi:hypothetical protein R2F25_38635 [Streptomyces sp. UP1A-1]|nr:hypothetical protein [Streptomyces sp. UP1A-1]